MATTWGFPWWSVACCIPESSPAVYRGDIMAIANENPMVDLLGVYKTWHTIFK